MIKTKELYKHFQADPQDCLQVLSEGLDNHLEGKAPGINPDEFSLRDLAAWFVQVDGEPIGHDGVAAWAHGKLIESSGAVSSSAFAVITQRVVNTAVLEGARLPDTPLSRLVLTMNAQSRNTRVPNLTIPLAEGKDLTYAEAEDKPMVSLYAEYVRAMDLQKRGAHLPITREAVLFDDTGGVLDAARRLGEVIALEKEIILTKFVAGLVDNCVIEKRTTDTAEVVSDLFLVSGRWTNQQTSNVLSDWTDIDTAENLLLQNTLPGTGYPPMLMKRFVLVPPQLRSTLNRILNATEVRTGSDPVTASANPLAGMGITPIVSPLLYSLLVKSGIEASKAAAYWFYGDLTQAVRYLQAWPLDVMEIRDDTVLRRADILLAFDVTESGIPVIVEPRVWCKNYSS